MINYPSDIAFVEIHAEKRIQKAQSLLGVSVVNRILAFALFLFGAKRKDIAQYLKMPFGTFLSFLNRIDRCGLLAFEDQRQRPAQGKIKEKTYTISTDVQNQDRCIRIGDENTVLKIPTRNRLQCRTVLLTFLDSGLLSVEQTAQALELSSKQTKNLRNELLSNDINGLLDKRKGQLVDYGFSPTIKSELIQQYVLNVAVGTSISSSRLSDDLKKRCDYDLVPRSIRLHINKLGLPNIRESLPELLSRYKKNSTMSSRS